MARQALSGFRIPVVTALPASPADGQEIKLKFLPTTTPAMTVPVLWHMQWDAALATWLPVGEQRPVIASYDPGASISMGANLWGTYDANDPRLTVPLAGTYEIESGLGEAYGGGTVFLQTPAVQGSVLTNVESSALLTTNGGAAQRVKTIKALALNDLVRQYYYLVAGTPQNIVMRNRYCQIKPMRIP